MSYSSNGRRPIELASKSSHHHIINDPEVQRVLGRIYRPPRDAGASIEEMCVPHVLPAENPIEFFITVDGGYTETAIEKEYPSRLIHFMQFGALYFKTDDLTSIGRMPFIAPEDMAKLKNIQRLKLVLPTKGVRFNDETSLKGTVLKAVYEFFLNNTLSESHNLLDTLAWFIFKRYKGGKKNQEDTVWFLDTNPLSPTNAGVDLKESEMDASTFTFPCPETGGRIYLTDVFRLQQRIDEELGATGILGYLDNAIQHLILIHIIRHLLASNPSVLKKVLFIKDGPASFSGLPAPMHKPMLDLVNWLLDRHNICMAGLEKSGAFVEHANSIRDRMKPGSILILNDSYIYNRISPGEENPNRPYADTSYYSHKVIYKTTKDKMYVVTLPVRALKKAPSADDIPNLHAVLANIEKLQCDMYDSAIFPVALVNKLVSLSAFPSQQILQAFARSTVG